MNSSIKGIGSSPIQPQIPTTENAPADSQSLNIQPEGASGFDSTDRLEPQEQSNPFSNLHGNADQSSGQLQQLQSELNAEKLEKNATAARIKAEGAKTAGLEMSQSEAAEKAHEAADNAQFWDALALGPERRAAGEAITDFAKDVAHDVDQAGKDVSNFIQDPTSSATKAAEAAAKAAEKAAEDAAKAAQQAAQDAIQAVEQEVQDIENQAEQAAEDAADAIEQAAKDAADAVANAASDAGDDVKKFFGF